MFNRKIWHPVLKATMNKRVFSFDGSGDSSLGNVKVYDFTRPYLAQHMYFKDAAEMRAFGEDCIEFASRCEGLRSLTESDVPANPKP